MFTAIGAYKVDWVDRTLALMAQKQLTQLDLADAIGYSQSGLNRILTRQRKGRVDIITRISKALGTSSENLLHGIDREDAPSQQMSVPVLTNAESMLAWGNNAESVDRNTIQWLGCPIDSAGSRSFAYKVVSDDMTAPYMTGCYVFVDPGLELKQGADALFRMPNGHIAFRQYQVVAGQVILKPRNPSYPSITADESEISYLGSAIGALIVN